MSMNHHAFILHNFKPDEILDNLDGNITWIPFRFYNQYLHPPNHFYQHILISLNISSLLHEIPEFMIILDMITECMWHLSTSDSMVACLCPLCASCFSVNCVDMQDGYVGVRDGCVSMQRGCVDMQEGCNHIIF